jgi:transposase-like protein
MILDEPYFRDETAAHAKLEQLVWPSGPVCPHCGALGDAGRMRSWHARAALWFCRRCRKQFRATMGTLFEGSKVPLHKWFQALFLRYATYRSISPHRLSLVLETTNKTSLAMVRRLDVALGFKTWRVHNQLAPPLSYRNGARAALAAANLAVHAAEDEEQPVPWVLPPKLPRQVRAFREDALVLGFNPGSADFDTVLAQIAAIQPARRKRHGAAAQTEAAE